MRKLLLLVILLFLLSSFASAQTFCADAETNFLCDDFEDNDLINPTWTDTTGLNIVSSGIMGGSYYLNSGPTGGHSYVPMNNTGTGMYNLSVMVRYPDASQRTWFGIYDTDGLSLASYCGLGFGDLILDDSCEGIGTYDGSSYFCIYKFGVNTNVEINMILNASSDTFDVYVDGVLNATNVVCRESGGEFTGAGGFFVFPDNTNHDANFDNIMITNASVVPLPLSITNSTLNMTSDGGCIAWRTDKTSQCNTTDGTPTTVVDTSKNAFCSVRTSSHTYSGSFNCSTTGGTSHICTVFNAEKLASGTADLFISCNSTDNSESDSTGAMRINMTAGTGGVTINNFNIIGDGCGATIDGGGLVEISQ